MTRGSRTGRTAALLPLLLCAVGCTTEPDVVAIESTLDAGTEGGFWDLPPVHGCRAGYYQGQAVSDPTAVDGGANIPFSGSISFTLVQRSSGEFLELADNSTLKGYAPSSPLAAHFSANIRGGVCNEGEVTTTLENGQYVANGFTIGFHGDIRGTYSDKRVFEGTWKTILELANPVTVQGTWFAGWSGAEPPPDAGQ